MVIEYENYRNDGWGLSELGFKKLYSLISHNPKQSIQILEFGSGVSTKFFSDLSHILGKTIFITSFDNSAEYMYNDKSDKNVVVYLRRINETDDEGFNQMFLNKAYDKTLMKPKTSEHLRNQFYDIQDGDLFGTYDYVLLDGPHGNGRSIAFLCAKPYLAENSVVFIDDYTHYDFVDRFLSIYDAKELFTNTVGNKNKWKSGGDFTIYKIKKAHE